MEDTKEATPESEPTLESTHTKTINFKDLAYGCIMGAFVGDAGGSYLEFFRGEITDEDVNQALEFEGGGALGTDPGQITDDSEMAYCLLLGILDSSKDTLQNCIGKRYVDWYRSRPIDIGITTTNAISIIDYCFKTKRENLSDGVNHIGQQNYKSKSNGCLMRITPLAVYLNNLDNEKIQEYTKMDLSLTHSNETCLYATTAYNIAIAYLLNNYNDSEGALQRVQKYFDTLSEEKKDPYNKDSENKLPEDIQDSWNRVNSAKFESDLIPANTKIGYIIIAFEYSFFYLKNNIEYDEAIRRMLKQGGDTDTNAAIVGGLLGARYGINGIPEKWRNAVLKATPDRPEWLLPQSEENFYGQIDDLIKKSREDFADEEPKEDPKMKSSL